MTDIIDVLKGVKRIGISGHLRPDGDCLGSCTALYTYLKENIKDIEIFVFLERVPENFMYLPVLCLTSLIKLFISSVITIEYS